MQFSTVFSYYSVSGYLRSLWAPVFVVISIFSIKWPSWAVDINVAYSKSFSAPYPILNLRQMQKNTVQNPSFGNDYQQCVRTLEEKIISQAIFAGRLKFPNSFLVTYNQWQLELNPYLQYKFDLWLTPWSRSSGILGYRPRTTQKTVNKELSGLNQNSPPKSWDWVAVWPLLYGQSKEFSSLYDCSYNKEATRTTWNAVYAVKGGKVVALGEPSPYNYYGYYVILEHDEEPNSPATLYAHLARIEAELQLGSRVSEGQQIAIMGSSGKGAGGSPHLHLSYFSSIELILKEDGTPEQNAQILYEKAQNPVYFLAQGTYPTNTYVGNYRHRVYQPSFFNQMYRRFRRYHEGIDFSGSRRELLPNWQRGVSGSALVFQYQGRADINKSPSLYQLEKRYSRSFVLRIKQPPSNPVAPLSEPIASSDAQLNFSHETVLEK